MATSDGHAGHVGHDVRATYRSVNEARTALLALERKGVDAAEIEPAGPGAANAKMPVTNGEQLSADLEIERHLERRGGSGRVIGAAAGTASGGLGARGAAAGAPPPPSR